jgi:hypothetical protein
VFEDIDKELFELQEPVDKKAVVVAVVAHAVIPTPLPGIEVHKLCAMYAAQHSMWRSNSKAQPRRKTG